MALEPRISLVTLGVDDIARATAFYERLGWKKSGASQSGISFIQLRGTVLALYGREALAEEVGVADTSRGFSGVTLAHNVASEALVDETYAFALECGATAVKPP